MDTDASAMKRSEESEVRMVHNVEAALTEKIGLWSPRNACMEQKKTYTVTNRASRNFVRNRSE